MALIRQLPYISTNLCEPKFKTRKANLTGDILRVSRITDYKTTSSFHLDVACGIN